MLSTVSKLSDEIGKGFISQDIIKLRAGSETIRHVVDVCEYVERMSGGNVEYLNYTPVNNDTTGINEVSLSRGRKGSKKKGFQGPTISTEGTYARPYNFHFRVSYKDEVEYEDMLVYIPIVSEDGINYVIRGHKYCVPIQIIDAVVYNNSGGNNVKYNEVVVKALQQDIRMRRWKHQLIDVDMNHHNCNRFEIMFSKNVDKIPFLLFFFAQFGFFRTLQLFGLAPMEHDGPDMQFPAIVFYSPELPSPESKLRRSYYYFKFGVGFIAALKHDFDNEQYVRGLVATIICTVARVKPKSVTLANISDLMFWTSRLGSINSQNKSLPAGYSLLTTFVGFMDPSTSKLLKQFLNVDLKSTAAVMRWVYRDFSTLYSRDVSLFNKRVRIAEYLISPLKNKLRANVNRFTRGGRGRPQDIKKVKYIVSVNPSIVLDAIVGKAGGLNIGRFSANVNDLTLYNSILKATQSGPDSPAKNPKYAPAGYKELHPSMIGRIDPIVTSVGATGIALSFNPNCKISDNLGFEKDIQ